MEFLCCRPPPPWIQTHWCDPPSRWEAHASGNRHYPPASMRPTPTTTITTLLPRSTDDAGDSRRLPLPGQIPPLNYGGASHRLHHQLGISGNLFFIIDIKRHPCHHLPARTLHLCLLLWPTDSTKEQFVLTDFSQLFTMSSYPSPRYYDMNIEQSAADRHSGKILYFPVTFIRWWSDWQRTMYLDAWWAWRISVIPHNYFPLCGSKTNL